MEMVPLPTGLQLDLITGLHCLPHASIASHQKRKKASRGYGKIRWISNSLMGSFGRVVPEISQNISTKFPRIFVRMSSKFLKKKTFANDPIVNRWMNKLCHKLPATAMELRKPFRDISRWGRRPRSALRKLLWRNVSGVQEYAFMGCGLHLRIDSQKKNYFHNVRAIHANRLKPAIRNVLREWPRYCRKVYWTKMDQNGPNDHFGQNVGGKKGAELRVEEKISPSRSCLLLT